MAERGAESRFKEYTTTADPFRPLGVAASPTGQRLHAATSLDTAAGALLCPSGQVLSPPLNTAREAPRGVPHPSCRAAHAGCPRLADQHGIVERVNLTIRQHVVAVGRRVITLCKGEEGLRHQLSLSHVYDNFCWPHALLRQPWPQALPTNGTGSATRWRPCTPVMAAELTDHVWSVREVLRFRVPPWPQSAGV
jgi:hypothetical protein